MTRGDLANKEVALGRIKRLASSGLPLEPFVRAVFELIHDAVPSSPNRAFHVGAEGSMAFIFSNVETERLVCPVHDRFYVEAPPEVSGIRIRMTVPTVRQLSRSKPIWQYEEIALPNFHRSEGFNTVFRPAGYHRFLLVIFREGAEFVGYYPIWRSADQQPFSPQDIQFVQAASPHIAHGLKAARLMERASTGHDGFVPLSGWGSGVVLMDDSGRLVAMDAQAEATFRQLGLLDGLCAEVFTSEDLRRAFDYVRHTLRSIFHAPGGGPFNGGAPVYWFSHWTGIVLKLRGVRMVGYDGRQYTNILIERGEASESRQRQLVAKWGLSEREAEVLQFIAGGKTGPEISILLGISHDTVRKHTSRILEKLRVETRTAAAAMALESLQGNSGL
jgi:DNA-binding CsgD family transcriptional regulator